MTKRMRNPSSMNAAGTPGITVPTTIATAARTTPITTPTT
jgi:hypothetical protein